MSTEQTIVQEILSSDDRRVGDHLCVENILEQVLILKSD